MPVRGTLGLPHPRVEVTVGGGEAEVSLAVGPGQVFVLADFARLAQPAGQVPAVSWISYSHMNARVITGTYSYRALSVAVSCSSLCKYMYSYCSIRGFILQLHPCTGAYRNSFVVWVITILCAALCHRAWTGL